MSAEPSECLHGKGALTCPSVKRKGAMASAASCPQALGVPRLKRTRSASVGSAASLPLCVRASQFSAHRKLYLQHGEGIGWVAYRGQTRGVTRSE